MTGHNQMECDSMHSAIATAEKNTTMYTLSSWDTVLRIAKGNNHNLVIPVKHKDVLDFKQVAQTCMRNTKTDSRGQHVNWLNIWCIHFIKGHEDVFQIQL